MAHSDQRFSDQRHSNPIESNVSSLRPKPLAAAIALALCAAMSNDSCAATINVLANVCELHDAIASANTNTAVGGCASGESAVRDVIQLPSGNYFTLEFMPPITSSLIVQGQGRDVSVLGCETGGTPILVASENSAPNVTLRNLTVRFCNTYGGAGQNGGGGGAGMGGAVFVYDGVVNIENVLFDTNRVYGGSVIGTGNYDKGGGGGGGLFGSGGKAELNSGNSDALVFGSGGGGGANVSSPSGLVVTGGSAGTPNGGAGGTASSNPLPGGFGGGGGGGASATGHAGAAGGFGGGGGGGGAALNQVGAIAGSGGEGGFGGGGGGGGSPDISIFENAGSGGNGGFGGGGGGQGSSEGGASATPGKSGFGAQPAVLFFGGQGAAFGGAIFVRSGVVTIQNSVFSGNTAGVAPSSSTNLGGAIFAINSDAVNGHATAGGSTQGMPTTLPQVSGCSNSFSANTAAGAGTTDTNNSHVYGVSLAGLSAACIDIFKDGFE